MTAAISAVTLLGLLSAGPKVAVFGFEGIGVDSITAMVATSLFRTELAGTGKFAVATADEIADVLVPGADPVVTRVHDAQEAARKIGAANAVLGSLSRLGTQTIGSVRLIDVASGKVEFQDQLATTSKDELDVVLRRLARAVATRTRAGVDVELGDITEKESKEVNRRQAFFGGGVALGGFLPVGGLGTNNVQTMGSLLGLYETPDFFAEVRYSGMFSSVNFIPLTIGVFKTTSRTDITPYYGGALGIGSYSYPYNYGYYSYRSGWGFIVAPGVGYMLFHTYDFHVMADARYYLMFGEDGVQHGPALSVSLAFRRGKERGGCCPLGL